jgi:2-polyprenyl-3-methyl-5-hydroxy-6-metoxy-1,4-benzoquinol methylase
MLRNDSAAQKEHFDAAHHQYDPDSILSPPRHTVQELHDLVESLSDIPKDQPILDFGSGTGRVSIALARAGHRVLAVDISQASLDRLQDIAAQLEITSIETATAIPAGRQFPAIVGADVLHHVNLDEFLPLFHAHLAPGGKLAFSEPNGFNPAWYIYLPFASTIRAEWRVVLTTIPILTRQLKRAGFEDIRLTGKGVLPLPLISWSDRASAAHARMGDLPLLRWVAYRYLVQARKP